MTDRNGLPMEDIEILLRLSIRAEMIWTIFSLTSPFDPEGFKLLPVLERLIDQGYITVSGPLYKDGHMNHEVSIRFTDLGHEIVLALSPDDFQNDNPMAYPLPRDIRQAQRRIKALRK